MAECQPLQLQEGKKLQELQPYDGCNPSVYRGPILLPRQANSAPPAVPPEMSSSSGSGRSATEARALKIHSEAERRRRERINAHLTTLRRMIPDTKQVCASFYLQLWRIQKEICITSEAFQRVCSQFIRDVSLQTFFVSLLANIIVEAKEERS